MDRQLCRVSNECESDCFPRESVLLLEHSSSVINANVSIGSVILSETFCSNSE